MLKAHGVDGIPQPNTLITQGTLEDFAGRFLSKLLLVGCWCSLEGFWDWWLVS